MHVQSRAVVWACVRSLLYLTCAGTRAAGYHMRCPPRRVCRCRSAVGPQLQIIDGQIVVNQESLVMRTEDNDDPSQYTFAGDAQRRATTASFTKRPRPDRWSVEDTRRFYRVRQTSPLPWCTIGA